ncbi:MAG: fluoride efflux transporter CrcB [Nitrospinota bacterium]
MFANLSSIALGGAAGAVARFWFTGVIYQRLGSFFPLGTLFVNVLAAFLIGLIVELTQERLLLSSNVRLFTVIGFLGSFSTFSAFSFETVGLIRDGALYFACLNIFLSITLTFVAVIGGIFIGRLL